MAYEAQYAPGYLSGLDISTWPTLGEQTGSSQRSFAPWAGVKTGLQESLGSAAAGLQAVGHLTGLSGVENWAREAAQSRFAAAQASSRPELEIAPWKEGGASWLPYVGYQVGKALPTLAAFIAASKIPFPVPKPLAALGTVVPQEIGGGLGLAGEAAQAAGASWARGIVGGTVAGYPQTVGALYRQGEEGGEPGQAGKALLLGAPLAALGAVGPAQAGGLLARGLEGGIVRRVATAGAAAAVVNAPQAALQTAAGLTFRDDLAPAEKMQAVVDSALSSAVIGGVIGGAFGALGARKQRLDASNDDITKAVDSQLGRETPEAAAAKIDAEEGQAARQRAAAPQVRDFENETSPQLEGMAREVVKRLENFDADPREIEYLAKIAQEIAGRKGEALGDIDPTTLAKNVEDYTATRRDILAMREQVDQMAGEKTDFSRNLVARNMDELGESVWREMMAQKGQLKAPMKRIVQAVGFMDAEGRPRNLSGELARAELDLQTATRDGDTYAQNDAMARIRGVQDQEQFNARIVKRLVDAGDPDAIALMREEAELTKNAVPEPVTTGVDVRQSPETRGTVAEGNAAGEIAGEGGTAAPVAPVAEEVAAPVEKIRPENLNPLFRRALARTGASITDDGGIQVELFRTQKPELAGQLAGRGGVFFMIGKEHPESGQRANAKNFFGGEAQVAPETRTVRNPLIVEAPRGGNGIAQAFDSLTGEGAYKTLRSAYLAEVGENPTVDSVRAFLEKYNGKPELAESIFAAEKPIQRQYLTLENIAAQLFRNRGYEGVLSYQNVAGRPRLHEFFDVRMERYPESTLPEPPRIGPAPAGRGPYLVPALRIAEGEYAVGGPTHGEALKEAAKAGIPQEQLKEISLDAANRYFLNEKGQYLDRARARTYAEENGLLNTIGASWSQPDLIAEHLRHEAANPPTRASRMAEAPRIDEYRLGKRAYPVRDTQSGLDPYRVRGAADVDANGDLLVYNITDNPQKLLAALKKSGQSNDLAKTFGNVGDDLGPGLYGSGNPRLWENRSAGKWDFLKALTPKTREAYSNFIKEELSRESADGYITKSEYEGAIARLEGFASGAHDYIEWSADQPFNIKSWSPDVLARLGVAPGSQPSVVTLRLRGKFLDLSDGGFSRADLEQARKSGYDGAYTQAGFSYQPQLVVWNKSAIRGAALGQQPPPEMPSIREAPAIRPQATPANVLDDHLLTMARRGDSSRDMQETIRDYSDDPNSRIYADRLHKFGVDPKLEFASPESIALEQRPRPGQIVYGSYNRDLDRINIYEPTDLKTTLLHDWTHAATDKALTARTPGPAAREFNSLFERIRDRYAIGDKKELYGFTNAREFLSEAMSNPYFADFLQSVDPSSGQFLSDAWQSLKNTTFKMLRMPERARTLFDQVMDADLALMRENVSAADRLVGAEAPHAGTIPEAARMVKSTVELGDEVRKALPDLKSLAANVREQALGWFHLTHIAEQYKNVIPEVGDFAETYKGREAVKDIYSRMQSNAWRALGDLPKKEQDLVNSLVKHSINGIDPLKTWEKHAHLFMRPNAPDLKAEVIQANAEANTAKQRGVLPVYENLRAWQEADRLARMTTRLNGYAERAGIEMGENPADALVSKAETHGNPIATRDFLRGVVEDQISTLRRAPADANLSTLLDRTRAELAAMATYPEFRFDRAGDYFVSLPLKLDPLGRPDQRAMRDLSQALARDGFGDVLLSKASDDKNAFIRLENLEQAANLEKLAKGWQKSGFVDIGDIGRGLVTDKRFLEQYGGDVRGAIDEKDHLQGADYRANMQAMEMDVASDLAFNRSVSQHGYSANVMRNLAHQGQLTANAFANLLTRKRITDTFGRMFDRVAAGERGALPIEDAVAARQVLNELLTREQVRMFRPGKTFADYARSFNTTWYLGLSVVHTVEEALATGLTLWPELAKTHGFAKSAKAIADVTGDAFKIMRAVATGDHPLDVEITADTLRRAGIPKATADFLNSAINHGLIDMGSYAREMGRASNGAFDNATDKLVKWSNAPALYSETLARVIGALASYKLHGDKPDLMKYVGTTIDNGLMNFGSWNSSRQTGKMGIAGQYSPIMFAFASWQHQMLQKLYREVGTAIGKNSTPDERAAAARFLAGHIGAGIVLTGTLGMPGMAVWSALGSKLGAELTGDREFDAAAAWRNFLSDTFGKEISTIIARGLPRAAGFDVGGNWGEQDIIPFSRILTDRRKLEEAWPDYMVRMGGSPLGIGYNFALGARDLVNGNFLEGLKNVMPRAIKGPIEAYRMSQYGYVDSKGRQLPMTAGAEDIAYQLLGFTPAQRAQYRDVQEVVRARANIRSFDASNIQKNLLTAIEQNNQDDMRDWILRAQEFDKRHPEAMILPRIPSALQARAKARALAQAGIPMGVKPTDAATQHAVRFGSGG